MRYLMGKRGREIESEQETKEESTLRLWQLILWREINVTSSSSGKGGKRKTKNKKNRVAYHIMENVAIGY